MLGNGTGPLVTPTVTIQVEPTPPTSLVTVLTTGGSGSAEEEVKGEEVIVLSLAGLVKIQERVHEDATSAWVFVKLLAFSEVVGSGAPGTVTVVPFMVQVVGPGGRTTTESEETPETVLTKVESPTVKVETRAEAVPADPVVGGAGRPPLSPSLGNEKLDVDAPVLLIPPLIEAPEL